MYFFLVCEYSYCFFFFSSRRRHTRFDCDWSSDVCSSDLDARLNAVAKFVHDVALAFPDLSKIDTDWAGMHPIIGGAPREVGDSAACHYRLRSEERRVGKECRSRWSPYH